MPCYLSEVIKRHASFGIVTVGAGNAPIFIHHTKNNRRYVYNISCVKSNGAPTKSTSVRGHDVEALCTKVHSVEESSADQTFPLHLSGSIC